VRRLPGIVAFVAFAAVALAAVPAARAGAQEPLLPNPQWSGPNAPRGHNEVFATGDGCAQCHSAAPRANAMRTATGDDVSPHALWQASVMANSARDPYWRAAVVRERTAAGEGAAAVEQGCVRCHAPMAHHSARLAGLPLPGAAAIAGDPLAQDGVSCTVCHQILPDGLGTDATFDGRGAIDHGRFVFGPYVDPTGGPMAGRSGYLPVHGAHVQDSAMCATCHTLHTAHAGPRFPEQTPYLEWRNSEFTTEPARTATSKSCQECHMPELAPTRVARMPDGREFAIPVRAPYRGHPLVGGNAFLLDLLAANRDALGVDAPEPALRRMALATRKLLSEQTVALEIGELRREHGELRFAVRVENLTGHKFPSGYPSRRAWLQLQVRAGRRVVFDSGGWTRDGALRDVRDPLRHGHRTRITTPEDVLVWELIAGDGDGGPTTALVAMAHRAKDNRLLPRGWRPDGPHAADTAPVAIGSDVDFTAGGDAVDVAIPLPANAPRASVVAWVRYQTIPPHWVEPLRALDAPECRAFVAMYDAADKTPETVAVAVRAEPR
jgi:hypothetical protein